MSHAHPEGMDEGPRRLGWGQRLIMGDLDRHGLSFAIERSIANSHRLVVSRSRAAARVGNDAKQRALDAHSWNCAEKGCGEAYVENRCRPFLRRLPHRPGDQARPAAHRHPGTPGAL